jgi:hypothetical protein
MRQERIIQATIFDVFAEAPAGILTTFGLFYAVAGAFYGLPIAVQPMKAASAAIVGAGLVIGPSSCSSASPAS